MGNSHINLKEYEAPAGVSDSQAAERIMSNSAKCPEVKRATPNPDLGIAGLRGKLNNYIIEHKHNKIHIKAKEIYVVSVIKAAILSPLALWFGYTFGSDPGFNFKSFALPLSLLLIAWGIVWSIGYVFSNKEQKTILSFIYNVINGNPADAEIENAKFSGTNLLWAIIPFLAGIAVLVLYFAM